MSAKGTELIVLMSSPFVASDVSSDDEPLINLKISASAKKPEKIDDTPPRANGTNNKKAGGYSVNVIIYVSCIFLISLWNGWFNVSVCNGYRSEYR